MSFECPPVVSHSRASWSLKSFIFFLMCSTIVSWAGASPASAQGILSRLRARIEARLQPPPPVPSPVAPIPRTPIPVAPIPETPGGSLSDEAPEDSASEELPEAVGAPDLPSFGIDVAPARVGQYQGLRVIGFQPNSRAPSAGLQPGDVIVSIQGQPTRSLADVSRRMADPLTGPRAEVQIIRNGRLYRTVVPVIVNAGQPDERSGQSTDSVASAGEPMPSPRSAAKPPVRPATGPTLARPRSSLGLEVRNATPQRGIDVVIAPEGTAGVIGGLKAEDRIVSVEGRLVKDIDGLIRELSVIQPGQTVRFGVVRGESMLELNVEMGGPGGKPIREANESNDPETAAETEKPNAETNDGAASILGGMGAALGGLFAPKGPSSNASKSPATQPNTTTGEAATAPGELNDPLALPEDDVPTPSSSVDLLPPPQREADAPMSEVERLRAEVERLKRQLNQK